MLSYEDTLRQSVVGLTHWTMSNKARRLARKARQLLESGADEVPRALIAQYEEDMDELRQEVRIMTSA